MYDSLKTTRLLTAYLPALHERYFWIVDADAAGYQDKRKGAWLGGIVLSIPIPAEVTA
jgi:hypothetical protein